MHSIIMIRTVFFILALSLSLFKLAHADQKIDLYSTPVNAAAQQMLDVVAGLYLDPNEIQASTQLSPNFKKHLIENDETKIKHYLDQELNHYLLQLRQLSQQGDQTAMIALFDWLRMSNRFDLLSETDVDEMEMLSEHGNPQASYHLALLFQGEAEYLPLLEKAGRQGSLQAQMSLADEYSFRLPIEQQDPQKAEYWSEQASNNAGLEKYKQLACQMANCDLPTWEAYDFGEDALEQLNLPE